MTRDDSRQKSKKLNIHLPLRGQYWTYLMTHQFLVYLAVFKLLTPKCCDKE